jgi:hypothetical protein
VKGHEKAKMSYFNGFDEALAFSRGALLDTRCLSETMKASANIESTYGSTFPL